MSKTFKKLWSILNATQRKRLVGLAFMSVLGAMISTFGTSALLPVIQMMLNPAAFNEYPIVKELIDKITFFRNDMNLAVVLIGALVVVFIIKNVYLSFLAFVRCKFMRATELEMQTYMMNKCIRRGYLDIVGLGASHIQRVILSDTGATVSVIENYLSIFSSFVTSLLMLMVILFEDPRTTLMLLCAIGIFALLFFFVLKQRLYHYGKISLQYGTYVIRDIIQALEGIKEVKIYENEDMFVDAFHKNRGVQMRVSRNMGFVQSIPRFILEALLIVAVLGATVVKLMSGQELSLVVAQLSVIMAVAVQLLPLANQFMSQIAVIESSKAAVESVHGEISRNQKSVDTSSVKKTCEQNGLVVLETSFSYPEGVTKVLDRANLQVNQGEMVALLGESGAGKSTTVDLLLGLLKPLEGDIIWDGKSINSIDWHSKIAYIPQKIFIRSDTIRNNVVFSNTKDIDDNRVWDALRKAELYEYVKGLPGGLDTVIGEGGIGLSGGQFQRVGIARALYREADILILDEATSALDIETESRIMKTILSLKGEKTIIMIAHHINAIEDCDRVFEIKDKKIYEKR